MLDDPISSEEKNVLLSAAALAPSMHNTQPWRFQVTGRVVAVIVDLTRALPAEDPEHRALYLSAGAALHNLRVAAASMGWASRAEVSAGEAPPEQAGRIMVDRSGPADPALGAQFVAIPRRRTNRQPFTGQAVPPDDVEALVAAAEQEGALLRVVSDPSDVRQLVSLAADAELDETLEQARAAERRAWIGGEREREGIPSRSLGPRSHDRRAPIRDLAATREDRLRSTARFEERPVVLVLSTSRDDPASWVRGGMALQRVLLEATLRGVATSFLNQALEHPDLRWLVRDPLRGSGHPLMVMRIGYGPDVPPTPRRPVHELDRDSAEPANEPPTGPSQR